MAEQLVNLALILGVTTAIVMLLRLFRQPPIISYIIAGIVLGPSLLSVTGDAVNIELLGQLGIALLLFIVGLNLDIRSLKRVGLISVYTGVGQVVFTSVLGFLLALALGFDTITSVYIAVALTFSSTIIIVKLLTDRRDLDTLYGKIALGFLVVQDIIAVIALMFISTFAGEHQGILHTVFVTGATGIIIAVAAYLISTYVLPYVLKQAGKNQEVIFLFSISWCLVIAALFYWANFSLEIGALIAGLMLASTQYSYEIISKVKPLRDFFITLFFIVLGSHIQVGTLGEIVLPAIVLSVFILIGNPLIVMFLMGSRGFSKRTSFMAGLTVAQISEFSMILVTLGVTVGHVSTQALNLVTIVGLVTILGSTYLILYADRIYPVIGHWIPYHRRGVHKQERRHEHHVAPHKVLLFGHNRMGYSLVHHFKAAKDSLLVIDFDPEAVSQLHEQGVHAILADASDAELYEELDLSKTVIAVSTVTDMQTSELILDQMKKRKPDARVIMTAAHPDEALALYDQGADYVIIPHVVGGDHAAIMLDLADSDIDGFLQRKDKHVEQLKNRGNQ